MTHGTINSLDDCLHGIDMVFGEAQKPVKKYLKDLTRETYPKTGGDWCKRIYEEVFDFSLRIFPRARVIPQGELLRGLSLDDYKEIVTAINPDIPESGYYLDLPFYPRATLMKSSVDKRSLSTIREALKKAEEIFQNVEKYEMQANSRALRRFASVCMDLAGFPELSYAQVRETVAIALHAGRLDEIQTSGYDIVRFLEPIMAECSVSLSEVKQVLEWYIQGMAGGKRVAVLNRNVDWTRKPLVDSSNTVILNLPATMELSYSREDNIKRYKILAAFQATALKHGTYELDIETVESSLPSLEHLVSKDSSHGSRDFVENDLRSCLIRNLGYAAPGTLTNIFALVERARLKLHLDKNNPALKEDIEELAVREFTRRARTIEKKETDERKYWKIGTELSWALMADSLIDEMTDPEARIYYDLIRDNVLDEETTVEDSWRTAVEIFSRINPKEEKHEGKTFIRIGINTPYPPDYADFPVNKIIGLTDSIEFDKVKLEKKQKKVKAERKKEQEKLRNEKRYLYEEYNPSEDRVYEYHCAVYERETQGKMPSQFELDKVTVDPKRVERIRAVLEILKPQGRVKVRGQHFGEIDLDRAVSYIIDLKAGIDPNPRMYFRTEMRERDVAVLYAIDVSGSTGSYPSKECIALKKRTIDAEKEGLIHLVHGSSELGDNIGVFAYSGKGREGVEVWPLKDFSQDMSVPQVVARIMQLAPQRENRTGAAYRHLLREKLLKQPNATKVFIDINDGLPSDEDPPSIPAYKGPHGIEDTKRVLEEAARNGVIAQAFSFVKRQQAEKMIELWENKVTLVVDPTSFEDKFVEWFVRTTLN